MSVAILRVPGHHFQGPRCKGPMSQGLRSKGLRVSGSRSQVLILDYINLKKCTSFEEKKGKRYIWGNVYFGIIVFSCVSSTKQCLRFLLICFAQEIKGFYQSSLGSEVDLRDIMNISRNTLAKN